MRRGIEIYLLIFLVICTAILFLYATNCFASPDSRFYLLDLRETEALLIDSATIRYLRNYDGSPITSQIDCWIKVEFTAKGIEAEIAARKKFDLPTTGYDNLAYSMRHYHLDIKDMRLKVIGVYDYANDGSTLSSYDNPNNSWKQAIPNSNGEGIILLTNGHIRAYPNQVR